MVIVDVILLIFFIVILTLMIWYGFVIQIGKKDEGYFYFRYEAYSLKEAYHNFIKNIHKEHEQRD